MNSDTPLGAQIAWDDTVLPFQLDRSDIRGRAARLDGVLDGILKLLLDLQKIEDVAYLFITHDLATVKAIADSIANGRIGQMPAHEEFLGEAKSHVLAAYVYSLSRQ